MPSVDTAAVALGSNLDSSFGGREENLQEAIARLSALGTVVAISTFIETEPVGYLDQPVFLNGALLLQTHLDPLALLRSLLLIEHGMGRIRQTAIPKGPRIVDLDLLYFGDLVLSLPELTLPHPAMSEREFVLQPLLEIAPHWVHPISGRTVSAMFTDLKLRHTPRPSHG